jgi:hypothetical protein
MTGPNVALVGFVLGVLIVVGGHLLGRALREPDERLAAAPAAALIPG